jgi:hypothetical protein
MDAAFNIIAYIAKLIVLGELFVVLVVPLLAIGAGGLYGLRLARRRLGGPIGTARQLPQRGQTLVDRACTMAAMPVIMAYSLWRAAATVIATLRRQMSGTAGRR